MVLIAAIFDKLLMEKLRNRSGQRENAAITGPNLVIPRDFESIYSGPISPRVSWTLEDDGRLQQAVTLFGEKNWRSISDYVGTKTNLQCRQRWMKCLHPDIKKGRWTDEEDRILEEAMSGDFAGWNYVADRIPGRTAKQCRERWHHYLSPHISKEDFTEEDDALLTELFTLHGSRWAIIAKGMPGRTESQVRYRAEHLKLQRRKGSPKTVLPSQTSSSTLSSTSNTSKSSKEEKNAPSLQRLIIPTSDRSSDLITPTPSILASPKGIAQQHGSRNKRKFPSVFSTDKLDPEEFQSLQSQSSSHSSHQRFVRDKSDTNRSPNTTIPQRYSLRSARSNAATNNDFTDRLLSPNVHESSRKPSTAGKDMHIASSSIRTTLPSQNLTLFRSEYIDNRNDPTLSGLSNGNPGIDNTQTSSANYRRNMKQIDSSDDSYLDDSRIRRSSLEDNQQIQRPHISSQIAFGQQPLRPSFHTNYGMRQDINQLYLPQSHELPQLIHNSLEGSDTRHNDDINALLELFADEDYL